MPGFGAPAIPKPRISARFTTAKAPSLNMPSLAAPKPMGVKQPKAGRLSATGGKIGGVPAPMAPRIPKPAMPRIR